MPRPDGRRHQHWRNQLLHRYWSALANQQRHSKAAAEVEKRLARLQELQQGA